jgi:hypothetical protein
MIIFNFLGMVPTVDYYWTIILHVLHTFSWAATVACLSKNFSIVFYRATLTLYGFATLLDLTAFVWRIITTSVCTSAECVAERKWGIIGYILSLVYIVWDIVVFVALVFVIRGIMKIVVDHAKQIKRNAQETDVNGGGRSDHPETDAKIHAEYSKLIVEPPSVSKFPKRFAIVIAAIIEPIFFFSILVITMFGLVISELFLWTIFLSSLHFFTWVFLSACIYNNYSRRFQIMTQALYATALVLDVAAIVWRSILLINCDPATNVDCIFRSFPDWFPIQLFTGILIVTDIVAFVSLTSLYRWLAENIWDKIKESESKIITSAKQINLVKRDKPSAASLLSMRSSAAVSSSLLSSRVKSVVLEGDQDRTTRQRRSVVVANDNQNG